MSSIKTRSKAGRYEINEAEVHQETQEEEIVEKAELLDDNTDSDEDSSRVSSQYFSLQMKPSRQVDYKLKGSWRLCNLCWAIVLGLTLIYLLNVTLETNCLQRYKSMECSLNSNTSKECLELISCIEQDPGFFTLQEKIVLIIGLVTSTITSFYYNKSRCPRLSFQAKHRLPFQAQHKRR